MIKHFLQKHINVFFPIYMHTHTNTHTKTYSLIPRCALHMGEKKIKLVSALRLYGCRPVLYGALAHLHVQGPDKRGQVLQVLRWFPIRSLSRRINITPKL